MSSKLVTFGWLRFNISLNKLITAWLYQLWHYWATSCNHWHLQWNKYELHARFKL